MKSLTILLATAVSLAAAEPPLRALMICGGCCHDYKKQSVILRDGIQARGNIQVDVVRSDDTGNTTSFAIYETKDWAKGYDVVIHNECSAKIDDEEYVGKILAPHKDGLPSVNLHCAMHSYRTGSDIWFEFVGLQSSRHGWKKPITVDFSAVSHPITEGIPKWTTGDEELYNNIKVFETSTPLALGTQVAENGKEDAAVVAWTGTYHGTKTFSTTLGHQNETVSDERYLNLVTRGLLWTCGKLEPAYLKPYEGAEGSFTVIPKSGKNKKNKKKPAAAR